LSLRTVRIVPPGGCNLIVGSTHFIKSAEDLYEAIVTSVPAVKFGLAFAEASGPCLIRTEGTDDALRDLAAQFAVNLSCGHTFIVFLRDAYPINVLNAIKRVPEVCSIFCATANPVEVVVFDSDEGGAVLGVVDGYYSKGIEKAEDRTERRSFLRKIGYKL